MEIFLAMFLASYCLFSSKKNKVENIALELLLFLSHPATLYCIYPHEESIHPKK